MFSLRTEAITSFVYFRHERVRALTLCWMMSILESIASWVRAQKDFLLLVFSARQFLLLSMGLVASISPRPWCFMFRATPWGEQRGGAMLVMGDAAAQAVRTVGGRRSGATPGPFGLVSTFLGAVSEGDCVDRWSGVATLEGVLIRA